MSEKTTTKRKNLMDAELKAERDKKISYFKVKQKQSYEFKVAYARSRAREFVKEWEYLMFHYCKDSNDNDFGWAKVLDYIGVEWQPEGYGKNEIEC